MRCSLEQLSCQPQRWRTLPVRHPALTPGNRQIWGAGKHSWALPVDSIHETCQNAYTFIFCNHCKRHFNFYQVIPGYSFTIFLGYPVDIEVKLISFVMKEAAWHSQDWPKGCVDQIIIGPKKNLGLQNATSIFPLFYSQLFPPLRLRFSTTI